MRNRLVAGEVLRGLQMIDYTLALIPTSSAILSNNVLRYHRDTVDVDNLEWPCSTTTARRRRRKGRGYGIQGICGDGRSGLIRFEVGDICEDRFWRGTYRSRANIFVKNTCGWPIWLCRCHFCACEDREDLQMSYRLMRCLTRIRLYRTAREWDLQARSGRAIRCCWC